MTKLSDTSVASSAEKTANGAGGVIVIDMQSSVFSLGGFGVSADCADSVLLGEHLCVGAVRQAEANLEANVCGHLGVVSCPLFAEGAMSVGVSLTDFGNRKLAAGLALRGPATRSFVGSLVELADYLKFAASRAALLCIRAWMRLVSFAHVDLVALLAERHKTVSAGWMSVKLGSWLKGATDPACFFHAAL